MTTKEELESLKKQIEDLEAKIANEEKQEIKTCEDAFNKLKPEWYISDFGNIKKSVIEEEMKFQYNKCNMTSEKEAKRIKALIQLRRNAEAMNEGVESLGMVHGINNAYELVWARRDHTFASLFPIFNTKELAEQALTNFRNLFEDLYA